MSSTNSRSLEKIEDDFLAEVTGGEVGGEIVLEDPAQADYLIQRIARLQRKQAEITVFVTGEMKRLQGFLERKLGTIQAEIDWRSGPLELYVRDAYRRSEGKIKSLDLPHGKLQLRAEQTKVILEEDKFWKWVGEHPDESKVFIEPNPVIKKDQLNDYVKRTSEIMDGQLVSSVDGITILLPGEPKFSIKIKEGGGE